MQYANYLYVSIFPEQPDISHLKVNSSASQPDTIKNETPEPVMIPKGIKPTMHNPNKTSTMDSSLPPLPCDHVIEK